MSSPVPTVPRREPLVGRPGWSDWLRQNDATVVSVSFPVFGVVLIGQGIATI